MVVFVEENAAERSSLESPSGVISLVALTVRCWLVVALSVLQNRGQNSECRGALLYHVFQLTSDCEGEWRVVAIARV